MESQSIQPQATVFSEKKAPQLYTDGRFTSLKTLTEDYTLSDKNNQYRQIAQKIELSDIIDSYAFLVPGLGNPEYKLLRIIYHLTAGSGVKQALIPYTDFISLSRMSENTIKAALRSLEAKSVIHITRTRHVFGYSINVPNLLMGV